MGCRIGMNYQHTGKAAYIGTRPSMSSIQSICRKVSEQTARRYGLLDSQEMVKHLNWMLSGWGNYFHLGQVSPAFRAVDAHACKRLRQWLCRKHKVRSGKHVRFHDTVLYEKYGLVRLAPSTKSLPWAKV